LWRRVGIVAYPPYTKARMQVSSAYTTLPDAQCTPAPTASGAGGGGGGGGVTWRCCVTGPESGGRGLSPGVTCTQRRARMSSSQQSPSDVPLRMTTELSPAEPADMPPSLWEGEAMGEGRKEHTGLEWVREEESNALWPAERGAGATLRLWRGMQPLHSHQEAPVAARHTNMPGAGGGQGHVCGEPPLLPSTGRQVQVVHISLSARWSATLRPQTEGVRGSRGQQLLKGSWMVCACSVRSNEKPSHLTYGMTLKHALPPNDTNTGQHTCQLAAYPKKKESPALSHHRQAMCSPGSRHLPRRLQAAP